jgi:two-component system, chemotaxis family, protein-glutamate methylesterase/glutaminase
MASADDPGVFDAGTESGEMHRHRGGSSRPDRLVAIGGSAGSIEALQRVVRTLPSSFPAAIVVVVHLPTTASSRLPEILTRAGSLPAHHVLDGEPLQAGRIHVAPPDRHVITVDGHLSLVEGPRENGVRPAIDPLLRSAARTWEGDVISAILSGTLDDGTAGTAAVHAAGGITVAQRPSDAICPGMPASAIEGAVVDYVVTADELGDLLVRLVQREDRPHRRLSEGPSKASRSTDLVCPECGGVLRQFAENGVVRFHCRVGHNYSPESLNGAQDARLEAALWAAIRSLEETASLSRRLANDARQRGAETTARRFDDRERGAAERADLIRSAILSLSEYEDTPPIAEAEPVASEDDVNRPIAVGEEG